MSPAPDGIGEEGRFSPGDEASLAALEARLTWRLIGLVVAANALLFAAIKLIP